MKNPLVNLWLARSRGDGDEIPARPLGPPAHLCNLEWKFVCECGYHWKATTDPVYRDGRFRAPRQQCVGCYRWLDGRSDSFVMAP